MKNFFIPLVTLMCLYTTFTQVHAQVNHVPNGSFEDSLSCPYSLSEMYRCAYWISYTKTTPDYYHSCNNLAAGVPHNQLGYQQAAQGNAYAGLITYQQLSPDYDEYIKTAISPLQTGKTYEVSMSVSLANESMWSSNNLGVYFFDSGAYSLNTFSSVHTWAQPHVSYSHYGAVTDTVNWVRLKGYLTADSAYDNMVIGDFKRNQFTSPAFIQSYINVHPANQRLSYYYIDSVVVKEVKPIIPDFDYIDTLFCAGDTFSLGVITLKKYNANNSFTVQMSNSNGNFNNAISIGSKNADTTCLILCTIPSNISNGTNYRIRVICSGPIDTSYVNSVGLKIGNIDSSNILVSPGTQLCTGDTLVLAASTNVSPTKFVWVGPNNFISNQATVLIPNCTSLANGNYYLDIKFYGCAIKDTVQVVVYPIPATPVATYNNPLCIGETLNLSATTVSGATYTWNGPGSFNANTQNPSRSNSSFSDTGTYTVTATISGCTSPAASVRVSINPVPFVVIFPTPADSICLGDAVTFTALPNNAGGTPQYRWVVNGQTTGTNSTVFTTTTMNNGDVVRCDMTDNTKCSSPYTDQSNDVNMLVLPWLAPAVTISASPNRPLNVDEYVTFTATPTNAGNSPKYQWKRNGQDVQGATGSVWSANTLNDNDSISVEIISNYKCPQPTTASSNGIRVRVLTSVDGLAAFSGLILYPNPNNGKFVLKGDMQTSGEVKIEIINTVGQVVYKGDITAHNNLLQEEINLDNVANGIYLLKLNSGSQTTAIRFRIER